MTQPLENLRPVDPKQLFDDAVQQIEEGLEANDSRRIVSALVTIFEEPGIKGAPKRDVYQYIGEQIGKEPKLGEDIFQSLRSRLDPQAPKNPQTLKTVMGVATSIDLSPEQLQGLVNQGSEFNNSVNSAEATQRLIQQGWVDPEEAQRLKEHGAQQAARAETLQLDNQNKDTKIEDLEADLVAKEAEHQKQVAELIQERDSAKEEANNSTVALTAAGSEISALEARIAALEAELKTANQRELAQDLAALRRQASAQLTGEVAEDLSSPLSDTEEWALMADKFFGAVPERTRPFETRHQEAIGFSEGDGSKRATLADFFRPKPPPIGTPADNSFDQRSGSYDLITTKMGDTHHFATAKETVAAVQEMLSPKTVAEARSIAEAIKLLGESPKLVEIYKLIALNLACGYSFQRYPEGVSNSTISTFQINTDDLAKFYMDVRGLDGTFTQLSADLTGLSSSNRLFGGFSQELQALQASNFWKGFKTLTQDFYPGGVWTKTDLMQVDPDKTKKIIEFFRQNRPELAKLDQTVAQISTLVSMGFLYSVIPEKDRQESQANFIWNPMSSAINIKGGRNLHSILTQLRSTVSSHPDFSHDFMRDIDRSLEVTKQSMRDLFETEMPIDIHLNPNRPIILLGGNNGGGKTHSMETLLQAIGQRHTNGTNLGSRDTQIVQLSQAHALIGTSKHSNELSSFQREGLAIATALKEFDGKDPEQIGVLVVDEVGKGTDSRDAVALMLSVAEYCRRRNIYLVMATHHGKTFIELAKKVGVDKYIQILAPNFKNHQLEEYDQVQDSKGVEVMQGRFESRGLPYPNVLKQIANNAWIARQAALTGNAATLQEFFYTEAQNNRRIPFMDQLSFSNLGLTNDKDSLKPVLDLIFAEGKNAWWRACFVKELQLAVQSKSEGELKKQRDLTGDLVTFMAGMEGERATMLTNLSNMTLIQRDLFDQDSAAIVTEINTVGASPDALRQVGQTRPTNMAFTTHFANSEDRKIIFDSLRAVAAQFKQSDLPALTALRENLEKLSGAEKEIIEVIAQTDTDKLEIIQNALDVNTSANTQGSVVNELAHLLNRPVSENAKARRTLAAKLGIPADSSTVSDPNRLAQYVIDKHTREKDLQPLIHLMDTIAETGMDGVFTTNQRQIRHFQSYSLFSLNTILNNRRFINWYAKTDLAQANMIRQMVVPLTTAFAAQQLGLQEVETAEDGRFSVKDSLQLALLNRLLDPQIVRQTLEFDSDTDVIIMGGTNGGGKTQYLTQMAANQVWAKATGFAPAKESHLPAYSFVYCGVNAGETTETASSFQHEMDSYGKLVTDYMNAGAPRNGIIFLDEPLAGTSSEDQIGILISLIAFFKQRNVKLVLTNHNYQLYDVLKRVKMGDGSAINFLPVSLDTEDPTERFKFRHFSPDTTSQIRSDGIEAARLMGVPQPVIDMALLARQKQTGSFAA